MLLVFTGEGKGKTAACVEQANRALGQDMRVCFAQFMKRDAQAGEQRILRTLLGEDFYCAGAGFFRKEEERPAHQKAVEITLHWAWERMASCDILILDEALYALQASLLSREDIEATIRRACDADTHLVLSGRNAPDWLCEAADLVSEINEVKHPWRRGIPAMKGIEF